MQISEIFASKKEQQNDIVGKVDCEQKNLVKTLLDLLNSVGMTNPRYVVSHSSKGVTIQRKGEIFTLTLGFFKPPLKLTWSAAHNYGKLGVVLENAASKSATVGYANIMNTPQGKPKLVQLAFAS